MRTLTSLTICSLLVACGAGSTTLAPDDTHTAQVRPALSYDVYTADAKGFFVTSTLIRAGDKAVLIDGQFNLDNGRKLAAWIAAKNVTLETIYITHAHPDHYFALGEVLKKFPDARVVATPSVVRHMAELGPKKLAYWGPIYKNDMATSLVTAAPLLADTITLAGHALKIVTVPQADTAPATVVHVPELGLVVAGDLAYAGVHVWLADAPTSQQRSAWVVSLRTIARLAPTSVVAGHKSPTASDSPTVLAETIEYLQTFEALRRSSNSGSDLEAALVSRYPKRVLPVIAKLAAQAAFAPAAAAH